MTTQKCKKADKSENRILVKQNFENIWAPPKPLPIKGKLYHGYRKLVCAK